MIYEDEVHDAFIDLIVLQFNEENDIFFCEECIVNLWRYLWGWGWVIMKIEVSLQTEPVWTGIMRIIAYMIYEKLDCGWGWILCLNHSEYFDIFSNLYSIYHKKLVHDYV